MRKVEFEEDNNMTSFSRKKKESFILRMAMKVPGVKTKGQANIVLVLVAIIALVATWWVITGGPDARNNQPTFIEDLTSEQRDQLPPEILESLPSRGE